MATTQTTTEGKGRNRNLRKGAATPELTSIGNVMVGKDQTPAVKLTTQVLAKDAPASVKLTRATLDKAGKIIGGFHKTNDELIALKDQADAKRGGLSDIVFQLCKLGASQADEDKHPDMRWAYAFKTLQSAEAYERQRWQKAHKLPELPNAKEALGASWQTYKSQLLRCVEKGLNPADFANGTVFREAGNNTGNKTRRARQTAGASAGAATVAGVLESATMRAELSAAIADLVKSVQALTDEQQLDFAVRIHRITVAATKLHAAEPGEGEQTETEGATGVM